jgi:pSer/pThr/pTyr-binding forkhead associated (FHA) protein
MDRIYKLVDIKKPETGNYLVMESLPLERNSSRTIHILGFSDTETQYKMGRGHDSEVRVNDISVSRTHAIINYTPGGFFIKDNNSKFGTLVLCKGQEIKLTSSKN